VGLVFFLLHLLAFVYFVAHGVAPEGIDLHSTILALLQQHFGWADDAVRAGRTETLIACTRTGARLVGSAMR
jgi:hypothetical protein